MRLFFAFALIVAMLHALKVHAKAPDGSVRSFGRARSIVAERIVRIADDYFGRGRLMEAALFYKRACFLDERACPRYEMIENKILEERN